MDRKFMHEAIGLARQTILEGKGGPFGAVIVRDGRIIGRGRNVVTSSNDPTAHAEIMAIRDACRKVSDFRLNGCEIFTSCEPCPMCLAAIYWARISKVYYACTREDAKNAGFDDVHFYEEISLPISRRRVIMEEIMRDDAVTVLDEWGRLDDKTMY